MPPTSSSAAASHLPSNAVQDYLKAIFSLERQTGGPVGTTVLAKRMQIAPASATDMVKKMAEMNLVRYRPYRGIELTPTGRQQALEVIRHHRLVELFLFRILGVPWDQVHAEAEKLEHVISEDLEDRIDALLKFPTTDPHGAPIPRRDGTMEPSDGKNLSELTAGQEAVIAEVSDHDSALLKYLGQLGFYPHARIRLVAQAPFDGPMTIEIGGALATLGPDVAQHIRVAGVRTPKGPSPTAAATTTTNTTTTTTAATAAHSKPKRRAKPSARRATTVRK